MATIDVKDAAGSTVAIEKPLAPGRAAAAASRPVALSNEDYAAIDGIETAIAATNSLLTTQAGYLDGIEGLLGTSNTNTAAGTTALQIIDDWDETDRCKVNPIVGQAGIAAGAGAVGSTVPRVTLASDDPAVASLSVLDDWDESDRLKANLIAGQAGVDGNNGAATAKTVRTTQAGYEYETVAASQTDQVLGATGAAGDYISHLIIQPATTGAGTCTLKDGTTVIFTFTSGTLGDLRPIIVPLGLISVNGAWKVTTGANVAVVGVGDFT